MTHIFLPVRRVELIAFNRPDKTLKLFTVRRSVLCINNITSDCMTQTKHANDACEFSEQIKFTKELIYQLRVSDFVAH